MLETTTLGPLTVSNLALGAMLFGTATEETLSGRLLDHYVASGGNFIDTSNNYAFWPANGRSGASEEMLGRWLKSRSRRDDLIIATKTGALPSRPGVGLEDIQGLGKDTIIRDIDDSLRRLGTDHVDLYYAHIDDRTTPLEETLAGFDAVVRAGKVRAIACSNHTVWRIERARQLSRQLGFPEYVGVQQHFSYFRSRPDSDLKRNATMGLRGGWGTEGGLRGQHLDYIRFNPEFRVIAYSPLLRGAYHHPEKMQEQVRTEDNARRRVALDAVAAELGATAGQVVLAWLLASTPQIIPLMAVSTEAQLTENLGAAALKLTPEEMHRLDTAV
jgi:aryl-alcohol dehydrogenase-like predicted oxidoreductase